jgi:5-methylcytosine-specific restriction endonuclease McrA
MAYIPNYKAKRNLNFARDRVSGGQNREGYRSDRWYHGQVWRRISERHRSEEIYCRECKSNGIMVIGDVCDHIIPIKMGGAKMDGRNLQTLCDKCHNKKRHKESMGFVQEYILNEDGDKIPK